MRKFLVFSLIFLVGCYSSPDGEIIEMEDELQQLETKYLTEIESLNNEITTQNSTIDTLKLQLEEHNTDVIEYESYNSTVWNDLAGYYRYIGDELPRIYPDETTPEIKIPDLYTQVMNDLIVEVIMQTSNNWYLVRIPFVENYVYVKGKDLEKVYINDFTFEAIVPETINGFSIGDDVDGLLANFDGVFTRGVEYGYGIYYDLFKEKDSYKVEDSIATITVDAFDRIINMYFLSNEFSLESGYKVGSNAIECIEYYSGKYENYMYSMTFDISESHYLSFEINTDELTGDSLINKIVVGFKQ